MAIFLCEPDNLHTTEKTNPLASGSEVSKSVAMNQFRTYIRALTTHGVPWSKTSSEKLNRTGVSFDLYYAANWGAYLPLKLEVPVFILSKMRAPHRRREAEAVRPLIEGSGARVLELSGRGLFFEGQADVKVSHGGKHVWVAYGPRTNLAGAKAFIHLIQETARSAKRSHPTCHLLHMTNPDYYHLDLAASIYGNVCVARENAFAPHSLAELQTVFGKVTLIKDDLEPFSLNLFKHGQHIFVRPLKGETRRMLEIAYGPGIKIHEINMSEAEKGGGSLKCLTLDTRPLAD
jgi:N-dimethylarginine dimethylaminohydrolase